MAGPGNRVEPLGRAFADSVSDQGRSPHHPAGARLADANPSAEISLSRIEKFIDFVDVRLRAVAPEREDVQAASTFGGSDVESKL